jgi:hypothetical protein
MTVTPPYTGGRERTTVAVTKYVMAGPDPAISWKRLFVKEVPGSALGGARE